MGAGLKNWKDDETFCLLELYAENFTQLEEFARRKPIFAKIAAKMKEKGYNRDTSQIQKKLSNLRQLYRELNTGVPGAKPSIFYDALHNILGGKNLTFPKINVYTSNSNSAPTSSKKAKGGNVTAEVTVPVVPTPSKKIKLRGNVLESEEEEDEVQEEEKTETVSLAWYNQPETIQQGLSRLFQEEHMLSDVTLVSSEGDFFQGHQVILSLCSPFFQKIFLKNHIDGPKKPSYFPGGMMVVLGNVSSSSLQNLLRFIYTGLVDIPLQELEKLVEAGKFLEVQGLEGAARRARAAAEREKDKGPSSSRSVGLGGKKKNKSRACQRKSNIATSDLDSDSEIEDFDFDDDTSSLEDEEEPEVKIEPPETPPEDKNNDEDADYNPNDEDEDSSCSEVASSRKSKSSSSKVQKQKVTQPSIADRRYPNRDKIHWIEIPPPTREELEKDWRVARSTVYGKGLKKGSKKLTEYYCVYGYRCCAARIKQFGLLDKPQSCKFYSNGIPHSSHIGGDGMGYGNKRFVDNLLRKGIVRPEEIAKCMEEAKINPPDITKIRGYIKRWRKKKREMGLSSEIVMIRVRRPKGEKDEPMLNPETGVLETEADIKKRSRRSRSQNKTRTEDSTGRANVNDKDSHEDHPLRRISHAIVSSNANTAHEHLHQPSSISMPYSQFPLEILPPSDSNTFTINIENEGSTFSSTDSNCWSKT